MQDSGARNWGFLDGQLCLHLETWIRNHYPDVEQDTAINRIIAYLDDYPELVNTRTWTEIDMLARREAGA